MRLPLCSTDSAHLLQVCFRDVSNLPVIQDVKRRPGDIPSWRDKDIRAIIAVSERLHEIEPRRLHAARLEVVRRVLSKISLVVLLVLHEHVLVRAAYRKEKEEGNARAP